MARYGGNQAHVFRSIASRAGAKADHTSPLRKVIRDVYRPVIEGSEYAPRQLLLECGHIVRPPRGGFTDDYPEGTRRRCRKCAEGKPTDADAT